ncbi:MoaF-related domain-containing protein [Glycomyces paridis]|uniref:Adenylate cyclase n=1 Tax=Glycomyces paridis TaxID=2126555 RepID=A0A4S8PHY5_9ACTN|nr:adenylate cyclase [Glycomyces paridis]THV30190.1 adenylate cyclase [Glycomyces paridis]
MSDFAFAGKTFVIHLDNGVVFHNIYGSEGNRLQYAEIDGATEGASGTVDLHVAEIARKVYLIGWNEVTGATVTQVLDFGTGTVTGFWSADEGGGRSGEIHSGTFEELG